ncbi:MAG: ABC transporter permease [Kiloniellales bacterium]
MIDRTISMETAPRSTGSFSGRIYALITSSEPIRGLVLLSPTLLVMLLAMCAPFILMVLFSFWTQTGFEFDTNLTLKNYESVVSRDIYSTLFYRSLMISGACTIVTVLLAYPMAYYVAFHVRKRKMIWIIMMTLPFWTSYLLRVFCWKIILGYNGVINTGLEGLGFISEPLGFLLYSPTAVVITLTHAWAAFAILPIYVSLEKIDRSLLEAATDLGDGPVKRFLGVTLPLSLPGVIAGTLLIFVPTVGDFVTPALVGGPDGLMIANIVQAQFGRVNNWPMGAALSIASMVLIAIIALVYMWVASRATGRRA